MAGSPSAIPTPGDKKMLEAFHRADQDQASALAPTSTALPSPAGNFEADPLNLRLLAERDAVLDVLRAWHVVEHQLKNGAIQEPPRRLVLRSRSLFNYLSGESDMEPTR